MKEYQEKNVHCCQLMRDFLEDIRVQIGYVPKFREYYIPLMDHGKITAIQNLFYCPWCGAKLPDSLRDQYFDILEKEHGIDDDLDVRVPAEFQTDEWWKKRGL